ncbi:MAG: chaperone NapD [Calditrichaeota bacterium]|nr:chaperone NapD [Calditrichota bacterium]
MPDKTSFVYDVLNEMKAVSLYGDDKKGNIIAVLETENKKALEELNQQIEAIDGVIKVMGVYHYFEDDIPSPKQKENAKNEF